MEKSVDKLYNVKKIRLERAKQGKSIRELADLAKLDPKTVSRIEKQKVIPRPQTIGKIAAALGKNYEDFFVKSAELLIR